MTTVAPGLPVGGLVRRLVLRLVRWLVLLLLGWLVRRRAEANGRPAER